MNKKNFRYLVVLSRTKKLKNCWFTGILHEINFSSHDIWVNNYRWTSEKRGHKFSCLTRFKNDVNLIINDDE